MLVKELNKYKLKDLTKEQAEEYLVREITEKYEVRITIYDGKDDNSRFTDNHEVPLIILVLRNNIVMDVVISLV